MYMYRGKKRQLKIRNVKDIYNMTNQQKKAKRSNTPRHHIRRDKQKRKEKKRKSKNQLQTIKKPELCSLISSKQFKFLKFLIVFGGT
jgi:formyltetrahydrofolate hydrolase